MRISFNTFVRLSATCGHFAHVELPLTDSSSDEEYFNIFLEYVPGGSVAALLRNYGAFEEPLVRNFVRQILEGLHYVHERGIVHRDIKGANVLVDNKGGIKISDFGISKKLEDSESPEYFSVFWGSRLFKRSPARKSPAPPFAPGLCLLDGAGGCQTGRVHEEG